MTRTRGVWAGWAMRALVVLWAGLLLGDPSRVWAHEGHDDGPAAPVAGAVPPHPTHTATTQDLEIVARHEPLRPGVGETLQIYVSDFATNAPIADAQIDARLASPDHGTAWQGRTTAGTMPGAYRTTVLVPRAGSYNLILVISGPRHALVAMPGVVVGAPAAPAATAPRRSAAGWLLLGGIALATLMAGIAIGTFVSPRKPDRAAPRGAAMSAAFLCASAVSVLASPARSHEGHDAGPASSSGPLQPGGVVWLAKESQFAAGIRTIVAQPDSRPAQLALLGRVVPSPRGKADVLAPQSGRLDNGTGAFPVVGQPVTRGRTLASLLVIDALPIRAPIGGVISEVNVVAGQTVQAGEKLFTIVDASQVWVHADVFPADIATASAATRALITVPGLPDSPVLTGRKVASGPTAGETPGTLELWFAVPNERGLLKIGAIANVDVESGQRETGISVPRSALLDQNGQNVVFVHTAPEQFVLRAVSVQAGAGDPVLLTSGIAAGERVVVSGAYQILTGGTPLAAR